MIRQNFSVCLPDSGVAHLTEFRDPATFTNHDILDPPSNPTSIHMLAMVVSHRLTTNASSYPEQHPATAYGSVGLETGPWRAAGLRLGNCAASSVTEATWYRVVQ
ncbi:hypothetical protein GCM10009541_20620 [Micromonospora gifhornensis]|uniref:Uncharacterized protein n=1 Tax=Micromonospora gifhornensis TaxID=84594 RepID=A0ABQ4I915_9ACTN|nr:hypothetical protein Vgi01_10680 [Micromonospora gifhornensis]